MRKQQQLRSSGMNRKAKRQHTDRRLNPSKNAFIDSATSFSVWTRSDVSYTAE